MDFLVALDWLYLTDIHAEHGLDSSYRELYTMLVMSPGDELFMKHITATIAILRT